MEQKFFQQKNKTLYLTTGGVIAALYVLLTLPFANFAFGPVQFRLAEAMAFLPILTPAAIPGLTIGCFLANLLNPDNLGIIDIVFGSAATLLAAILTRFISVKLENQKSRDILALTPPVLCNALIVGTYLTFLLANGSPATMGMILMNVLSIALSETFVVYVLGLPVMVGLRRTKLIQTICKQGAVNQ